MKNIQGVKIGNVVNLSIDGKLYKKNCGNSQEANELFKLVLKAKEDPTDLNIKNIRVYINEKIRIALYCGLETDVDNGEVYLEGFNTPLPLDLVEVIKEYHDNEFPLNAILNFWKLLMINPDVRVRTSLFDFIKTHDFVLTDNGYMLVYKAVDYFKDNEGKDVNNDASKKFVEFVSNQYLHVKKDWKCSPNKYTVYQNSDTLEYAISKTEVVQGWDCDEKGIMVFGKLGDLFDKTFNTEIEEVDTQIIYTDIHTNKMQIVLGRPVKMKRKECDSDPAIDCSYGLHVGATKYVQNFGGKAVLVCLVNPAHVVAVPNYDHSKMRVAEYFPFALATYLNGKIDIVEQPYFESDYKSYEEAELNEMIAKVKLNEKPIAKALNVEEEMRPMSELLKMLENRLYVLEGISAEID